MSAWMEIPEDLANLLYDLAMSNHSKTKQEASEALDRWAKGNAQCDYEVYPADRHGQHGAPEPAESCSGMALPKRDYCEDHQWAEDRDV